MYIHNWLILWILPTSPTCFNRKGHLQVAIPEIQEEAAPPRVSSEPPWINEIHGMWIWVVYGLNIVTVARNGARFGARRKQQNPGKSMTYVQRGFPKIRHTQPPCASVFCFPS